MDGVKEWDQRPRRCTSNEARMRRSDMKIDWRPNCWMSDSFIPEQPRREKEGEDRKQGIGTLYRLGLQLQADGDTNWKSSWSNL